MRQLARNLGTMGSEFPGPKQRRRTGRRSRKDIEDRQEVIKLITQLDPQLYPAALAGLQRIAEGKEPAAGGSRKAAQAVTIR